MVALGSFQARVLELLIALLGLVLFFSFVLFCLLTGYGLSTC